MTLAKKDLVNAIHYDLGYSKVKSVTLIQSLLDIIKNTHQNGQDVFTSGFCKFRVKEYNDRRGRKIEGAVDMMFGVTRAVTFRCSPVLKKKIIGEG